MRRSSNREKARQRDGSAKVPPRAPAPPRGLKMAVPVFGRYSGGLTPSERQHADSIQQESTVSRANVLATHERDFA